MSNNNEQQLRNRVLIRASDNQDPVTQIVKWLRAEADQWQTVEGPHDQPKIECGCCFACSEAATYRIIADAIENGEHRKDR